MAEEGDLVDDAYGSRAEAELPFDITIRSDTTSEELTDILAEERDFLHYIGHIDDDGFRCTDGRLDASQIEDVGVDAFFLNACQSYEQGTALVEAGAIGGIVTVRNVANLGAVKIGRAVAQLLNSGFPLRPALDIARDESIIGCHYIVVGDGGLSIVQPMSGTPYLGDIEQTGEKYKLSLDLFGASPGMGGVFSPHLAGVSEYYLASGSITELVVTGDELDSFLHNENFPVRRNSWLEWSNELSAEHL
ncbi:hypothetical protein L593_08900 [Salinarchaeum sp. Harcht-Bsk1]|nr:hypothetical protein L593_08900 [Salinarchaeum sp. Harcht-Bsk1]